MVNLNEFNTIVGDTIMECQRIEHDIKMIYAGMLKGDLTQNLKSVKYEALGQVLIDLEKLDNSDKKPYLTADDYRLLKEIKNIRNWLVHKSYMDFIYESGDKWTRNMEKSYSKLIDFYNKMKTLGNQIEELRIEILKHFGRI